MPTPSQGSSGPASPAAGAGLPPPSGHFVPLVAAQPGAPPAAPPSTASAAAGGGSGSQQQPQPQSDQPQQQEQEQQQQQQQQGPAADAAAGAAAAAPGDAPADDLGASEDAGGPDHDTPAHGCGGDSTDDDERSVSPRLAPRGGRGAHSSEAGEREERQSLQLVVSANEEQLALLREASNIDFITADGERYQLSAANARRLEMVSTMLDCGMGFEVSGDGHIRVEIRGTYFRRIKQHLEEGRVHVSDVRDWYNVLHTGKYLGLTGLENTEVHPLGVRVQLKVRNLVISECDRFIDTFFTPYIVARVEKGCLEFTVDITDRVASMKRFVNVMEREVAANLLKNSECRRLWVNHMQDTLQMRINVKDTTDEHGQFINFRASIRPAEETKFDPDDIFCSHSQQSRPRIRERRRRASSPPQGMPRKRQRTEGDGSAAAS